MYSLVKNVMFIFKIVLYPVQTFPEIKDSLVYYTRVHGEKLKIK